MKLILASQSPRRRELIKLINLPFRAISVDADEDSIQDDDLQANVQARAILKAESLQSQLADHSELIIGADTAVSLQNRLLNKPNSPSHAKEMLLALRGKQHEVHSGVVMLNILQQIRVAFVNTAVVTMRHYSNAEIDAYIQTGDPLDKAGGYAIQHPVFKPVSRLDGCYLSVMGFPVCQIILELQKMNIPVQFNAEKLKHVHETYQVCPQLTKLLSQ